MAVLTKPQARARRHRRVRGKVFGTVNRFFFASSTAFEIASGTSRALP